MNPTPKEKKFITKKQFIVMIDLDIYIYMLLLTLQINKEQILGDC